jgi:uncharacterized protein (DUF1684 family)
MRFWPVLVLALTLGCEAKPEDYVSRIAAGRASKDDNFKNSADSPVPADKKATLIPLTYFPIDENYAVPATLVPAADRVRIQVPTSAGKLRNIERVGTLKFTLKGQPLKLSAFLEIDEPQANRLFVPFTDLTSGAETYPAGRYMELDPTPTGIYVVDFNIRITVLLLQSGADCPSAGGKSTAVRFERERATEGGLASREKISWPELN